MNLKTVFKKEKIILFILILMAILIIPNISFGKGSFSISSSSKSITKGSSSSLTISAKNCAGQFKITSSNSSVVSVSSSSIWLDSSSSSITLKAKSTGTATITITAVDVTDTDLNDITGSKTCRVTVKSASSSGGSSSGGGSSYSGSSSGGSKTNTEEEKSSDATLKELSIKEGKLSPKFDKSENEYTLTVPNEVTKLNITATPNDSKATVSVKGNKDLKVGENTVTIVVTAEDGTTKNYVIKVTKENPELALQSIVIKYTNQEGQEVEVPLTPVFALNTYEYTLENLEYWVEKLNIEAVANIKGATVEIEGNENLVEGENIITITVKAPVTTDEETEKDKDNEVKTKQEEVKVYTIKVSKNAEPAPPTLMGRIKNWFNGMFGGVTAWYNQNKEEAIMGALGVCIVALLGLSIYIVVDYNKYKDVISKLKKVNEVGNVEHVVETGNNDNNIESIYNNKKEEMFKTNNIENNSYINIEDSSKTKAKGGRHF